MHVMERMFVRAFSQKMNSAPFASRIDSASTYDSMYCLLHLKCRLHKDILSMAMQSNCETMRMIGSETSNTLLEDTVAFDT